MEKIDKVKTLKCSNTKKELKMKKLSGKQKLLIFLLLWCLMYAIDYALAHFNRGPIFCIPIPATANMNGTSLEYYGLGYKVIKHKKYFNPKTGYTGRDDTQIAFWFGGYE